MGENLEEVWGAKIYSTYASSETITSFCECTAQRGGHLHPDLAVVEIVNEQGEVLAPGETGEVVVTPLQIEGMPLLRFRTGDISFMVDEPCACGRFSPRLGPILGRKKQMIKFRGTTLYPNSLYAVLDSFPGHQRILRYGNERLRSFRCGDRHCGGQGRFLHRGHDHGQAPGAFARPSGSDRHERGKCQKTSLLREFPEINPICR